MMLWMTHVGAYMIPIGVFTFCVHLAPTAPFGLNRQIWLVEATLMLNPPRMNRLLNLFTTANPPGRVVPLASPGQLSALVRVVIVSVIGLYWKTRAVAVVAPAALPPRQ